MTDHIAAGRPCVVIPTRNEPVGLVVGLIHEIQAQVSDIRVIVVDDSPAGYARTFNDGVTSNVGNTSVISRCELSENRGGLGGAVLAGFQLAARDGHDVAVVMDGDGQHPPAALPKVLAATRAPRCQLVVASRYRDGGSSGQGLTVGRRLLSRLSGGTARAFFPIALGGCSDPMSGFFAVRLDAVDLACYANGFKILLQLLAQHPHLRRAEVGYTFLERRAGESKAGVAEGMRYLSALTSLRLRTAGTGRAGAAPIAVPELFGTAEPGR